MGDFLARHAPRVDSEKIAAFQRKVGMDIFDAKKRRK